MEDSGAARKRDADLVSRFLAGDAAAFEGLLTLYGKPIYNFIRRFLGDPEASRDVFQETLLAALRSLDTFDSARAFLPWALGIAVNRCREEKRRRTPAVLDPEALGERSGSDPGDGPDRIAANRELAGRVADAVALLDDAHRAVFLLRVYEECTYREIAEILTLSEGTAKSRMHTAVFRVRKHLHGQG